MRVLRRLCGYRVLLVALAGWTLLWAAVALGVGPYLIREAYHERSWSALNEVISGRASRPVEYYLDRWFTYTTFWYASLGVLASAAYLATRVEVCRYLERSMPSPPVPAAASAPMAPGRRLLVSSAMGVLIVGSLLSAITTRELWPISPYHMYAVLVHEPYTKVIRVYVVDRQGAEMPLAKPWQLEPFDPCRTWVAIDRVGRRHGWDSPQVRRAIVDIAGRYERRRRLGEIPGPAAVGARLYEDRWPADVATGRALPRSMHQLLCQAELENERQDGLP